MAVESFPNIPHNSRTVSLAENEQLWAGAPSGLIGYAGTTPVYADSTGKQVKVRAGVAGRLRGTRFNNTTETIVGPFANNTSGQTRIDLVCARLDRPGGYVIGYTIIAGIPATNPVAPQPVRAETAGAGYFDQPLAEVRIAHNYTSIAAGDVTNRAWWIGPAGYHGFDTAKPPAEAGAVFHATDTSITYIGTTAGSWQRLRYNTGWKKLNPVTGWTFGAFHFARSGDVVVMNCRLIRTGEFLLYNVTTKFGPVSTTFRPEMTIWGVYHCSAPDHSSHATVGADGLIQFAGTGTPGQGISQNANLTCNMVWIAAD